MSVNDYLERARRHEDQESWGEALYLYERAIQGLEEEGNPDPELFSRAGDLQLRLKRPKEAAASYDKAIDLYVSRTNLDGAFAVCQKVLRHLPDLEEVYLRIARIRAMQGYTEWARQHYLTYAQIKGSRGDREGAVRALEELIGVVPADVDTRLFVSERLIAIGRRPDALMHLRDGYERAFAAHDRKGSERLRDRISELDPQSPLGELPEPARGDAALEEARPAVSREVQREKKSGSLARFLGALGLRRSSAQAEPQEVVAAEGSGGEQFWWREEQVETHMHGATAQYGTELERRLADAREEHDAAPVEERAAVESPGMQEESRWDTPWHEARPIHEGSGEPDVHEEWKSAVAEPPTFDPSPFEAPSFDPPAFEPPAVEPAVEPVSDELAVEEPPTIEAPRNEAAAPPNPTQETVGYGLEPAPPVPPPHETYRSQAPKAPRPEPNDDAPTRRISLSDAPRREGKVFYAPPIRQTEPVRQPEPVAHTEAVRHTDPAPRTAEEELAAEEAEVLKLLAAEPFEVKHHERFVRYAAKRGEQDLLVEGLFHMAIALRASGFEWRAKSTLARILSMEPNNHRALEALGYGKPGAESDPFLRTGTAEPVRAASDASPAGVASKPVEPAPTIPSQLFETASSTEPRPESEVAPDGGYVDLAALILDEPAEATTRWQVEYQEPAPNEEADFGEILAQFKQQVSQHLERSDARAHYDLGSAYKGMGLVQEAIAMFQKALRAEPDFLPAIEMLGRCFLDNGDIDAGINALKRGLAVKVPVEDDLLGVYYYLGNAHELQGNKEVAKDYYLRVFSCDINFLDVTERLRALR